MPFTQPISAADYPRSVAAGREAGLSKFFVGVYGWLSAGVALSGVVSLVMLSQPALLMSVMRNPFWLFGSMLLQLGLVTTFSARASHVSTFAAANMYFAYAALMGVWLAPVAFVYTGASIARALFTAAAAFAGLGIWGASTKRSLTGLSQYLMVGLVGGVVLMVANIFLRSSGLDFALNMTFLLVFLGMIAWEHQNLKNVYARSGTAGNASLVGAFSLYATFINLTLTLLRLFGARRED